MNCTPALVALLALAALLASLGCSGPQRPPPSIVIVLVDELRQDVAEREMEKVNALAARGVVAEQMRSAAPWTYPSVVSLLSGLYPQQHGATARYEDTALSHFDAEVPLLHRTLRAAGYGTAAFITNPFLLEWNLLHEGFDEFDGHFIGSQGNHWGFQDAWARPTMFADSVNQAVRGYFDAKPRTRPEFTYVHYIDVHGPWKGAPFPSGYVHAARFVDEKVAELYAFFHERYEGDLLFLVTADHGRALGKDPLIGHGHRFRKNKHSVHDFNLRVPFVVLPGKRVPEGHRIQEPASLIDVVPTLLAWAGLAADPRLPGVNLYPAIRDGESVGTDRVIYARNIGFGVMNDGIVYRGHKYVRFFDVDTQEIAVRRVFDLTNDPDETKSIAESFGPAVGLMQEAAGDHGLRFEAEFHAIDPVTREQLRELGYILTPDGSPAGREDAR